MLLPAEHFKRLRHDDLLVLLAVERNGPVMDHLVRNQEEIIFKQEFKQTFSHNNIVIHFSGGEGFYWSLPVGPSSCVAPPPRSAPPAPGCTPDWSDPPSPRRRARPPAASAARCRGNPSCSSLRDEAKLRRRSGPTADARQDNMFSLRSVCLLICLPACLSACLSACNATCLVQSIHLAASMNYRIVSSIIIHHSCIYCD